MSTKIRAWTSNQPPLLSKPFSNYTILELWDQETTYAQSSYKVYGYYPSGTTQSTLLNDDANDCYQATYSAIDRTTKQSVESKSGWYYDKGASSGMYGDHPEVRYFCAVDDSMQNITLYAIMQKYIGGGIGKGSKSGSYYNSGLGHYIDWTIAPVSANGAVRIDKNPWISTAHDLITPFSLTGYEVVGRAGQDYTSGDWAEPNLVFIKSVDYGNYRYYLYSIKTWSRGAIPPRFKFFLRGIDQYASSSTTSSWPSSYTSYTNKTSDAALKTVIANNSSTYFELNSMIPIFTDLPSDVYAITVDGFERPTNSNILLPGHGESDFTVNFNWSSTVNSTATITLQLVDSDENVLQTLKTINVTSGTHTEALTFGYSYERYVPANKTSQGYYFRWVFNANGDVYRCNNKNVEITSGQTTLYFVPSANNTPLFASSSTANRVTLYRNHPDLYALLANNEDYMTVRWSGYSYAQVDSTLILTILFGDTVQTSVQTGVNNFNLGPYIAVPYQQGQLFKIYGYLTDVRGRRSETKEFLIYSGEDILDYLRCYLYSVPRLNVSAFRCDSTGTPDETNGQYIKFTYTWSMTELDYKQSTYSSGTTDGSIVVKTIPTHGEIGETTSTFTITSATGTGNKIVNIQTSEVSFDVTGTVTDFIGKTSQSQTRFIPSSRVYMDFRYGGDGFGIGKTCESENALEIAWNTTIFGDLDVRGNINYTGDVQTASSADAITYRDTKSIGATNVQSAIDVIASKAGLTKTQVNQLIDEALAPVKKNAQEALTVSNDANANSQTAVVTANGANTMAQEALTTATGIDAKATQALQNSVTAAEVATQAQTDATQAKADSAQAKSDAAQAKSDVENAVTTANQAKATADGIDAKATSALEKANEAYEMAEDAATKANQAVTDSTQAKSDAAAAVITANQAKTVADGIDAKATGALQYATQAKNDVDQSIETANQALEEVRAAVTAANQAITTANGIAGKAQQALDNSTEALETANQAKTTADGIDGKATQALSVANGIDAKAQQALDTANGIDAKATEALNNSATAVSTAAQASSDASSALNKATQAESDSAEALERVDEVLALTLVANKVSVSNHTETNVQTALDYLYNKIDSLVDGNNVRF